MCHQNKNKSNNLINEFQIMPLFFNNDLLVSTESYFDEISSIIFLCGFINCLSPCIYSEILLRLKTYLVNLLSEAPFYEVARDNISSGFKAN